MTRRSRAQRLHAAVLAAAFSIAGGICSASDDAEPASHLALGVGAAVSRGGYAGQEIRVVPIPVVSYDGPRFFVHGVKAGWRMADAPSWKFDAVVVARFDGIDARDFSASELARRGIDRSRLDDRDDSIDAGFDLAWQGRAGRISMGISTGVRGDATGMRASLGYEYDVAAGPLTITPLMEVGWLSELVANYRFGTTKGEVARGVMRYRPGDAVVGTVGARVVRAFGDRWFIAADFRHRVLSDPLAESPLIARRGSTTMMLGVVRRVR